MLGDKIAHFQGKGKSPEDVAAHITEYLTSDGFHVQSSAPSGQGTLLQAKKHGWYRDVIDADRAMSISITGTADDLTVHVGIGRWVEHLTTAVFETLVMGDIFLVIDVAESFWTIEIEDKLIKDLTTFVG